MDFNTGKGSDRLKELGLTALKYRRLKYDMLQTKYKFVVDHEPPILAEPGELLE